MDKYENIRDLDDEIFEIVKNPIAEITAQLFESAFPKTFLSFCMFNMKIDFIKNSIYDLFENEGIYSSKILYRSLIEHSLRFQYLFIRFGVEKNDTPGVEYELFSELSEDIEYGKAWQEVNKIYAGNSMQKDVWEILKEIKPEYKEYSKQDIEKKAAQFRYKNIIRYINTTLSKKNDSPIPFLMRLFPEYSELSSFVHGGAFANSFILQSGDPEKREKEHLRLCNMALLISFTAKYFTFIAACRMNKKYLEIVRKLDSIYGTKLRQNAR